MRKQLLGALALAAGLTFQTVAQDRGCASHEVFEQQIANNPEFAARHAAIEKHTQNYAKALEAGRVDAQGNIVIPCIIQVVYSNSQENISDAQIQSQIDRLNEDFSASNSDYNQVPSEFANVRSGDTKIQFEVIEIKRNFNSRTSWGTSDAVKAEYPPIEPDRILTMWVCNIGNSILGYAQFPGGNPATDGVVMSPQFFGDKSKEPAGENFYLGQNFDLGRTATHEVGHWLNLRHIWGDGNCNADDFVSDTPVAGNPNYGCPSYPTNSCSSTGNDMTMNYMDYVNDACMYMFSQGQDARMQATFANGGGRAGFKQEPNYNPGGGSGGDGGSGGGDTCSDTEVAINLTFDQYPGETTWTIENASGSVVASGNGSGQAAGSSTVATACLPDGSYTFTINDSYGDGICCAYGNGSYSVTNGSTALASGGSFGSSESTSFTIGSPSAPTTEDVTLSITYDNYPQETSWTLSQGSTVIAQGQGARGNNSFSDTFTLTVGESYTYRINDSYGDGICCSYGNGSYALTGSSTYASGGQFGRNESTTFTVGTATRTARTVKTTEIDPNLPTKAMSLFPNPAKETLNVQLPNAEGTTINVYSISGQLMKSVTLESDAKINIADLNNGIYLLKATNEIGVFTQRFTKQ